jgi:hypothetical protein
MGLRGLLRPRSKSQTATALTLHAGALVHVVGESYRQEVLRSVATRTTDSSPFLVDVTGDPRRIAETELDKRWFRAVLVPEPSNEYDRNAVAVHAEGVGQIGYLSREDALEYRPVIAALRNKGALGTCPAFLIGGTAGKPSYGAILCLSDPEQVLADLRASE